MSQTSFLNIASWKIHSPTSLTSDIALPGAILGLHLIQNVRTGEELLVGGSDDGSVGVWSFG